MTTKTRQIIKDVIEENAVECKKNTTKALYEKVGTKLQEKYVEISKNIFEDMAVAGIAGDSDRPEMARFGQPELMRPSDKAPVPEPTGGNIPAPPAGAPPQWVNRWNYVFQNWNNPNAWQGSGPASSPGAYLGWLLGQWGNPAYGNWG